MEVRIMDSPGRTSRRALLKATGVAVGVAGAAIAAAPVAALAGTDSTPQVDEGAINMTEASTVVRSSSVAGAAFVGQSTTGLPGLYGHTAAVAPGQNVDTSGDFSGVVGEGIGSGAVGVTARQGQGAYAALVVQGRARFSRSGRTTVNPGKSSRKVTLPGVNANSLVFAVLARNVANRYVRAVVPVAGSFTIYLNRSVGSPTAVTWIVFDPNPA
jgi:hypothetical protein